MARKGRRRGLFSDDWRPHCAFASHSGLLWVRESSADAFRLTFSLPQSAVTEQFSARIPSFAAKIDLPAAIPRGAGGAELKAEADKESSANAFRLTFSLPQSAVTEQFSARIPSFAAKIDLPVAISRGAGGAELKAEADDEAGKPAALARIS